MTRVLILLISLLISFPAFASEQVLNTYGDWEHGFSLANGVVSSYARTKTENGKIFQASCAPSSGMCVFAVMNDARCREGESFGGAIAAGSSSVGKVEQVSFVCASYDWRTGGVYTVGPYRLVNEIVLKYGSMLITINHNNKVSDRISLKGSTAAMEGMYSAASYLEETGR